MSQTCLDLVVVIIDRGKGEKLADQFTQQGLIFQLLALGKGTAPKKHLTYLGLGEPEKDILFCTMTHGMARYVLKKLNDEHALEKPGHGIAFTIPIVKSSSPQAQKRFQGILTTIGEEEEMDQEHEYDVIFAITTQGYAEEVMDCAKSAGATGGTILHVRRVGMQHAEKFFGISIQPEKEMLLILVKKEGRQLIMDSITKSHGLHTDAKTVSFSMAVNGVAGLPLSDSENN